MPILLKIFHEIERGDHYQTHSKKPVLYSFQNKTIGHKKIRKREL
jgi:hypothetical protein